METPGKTFWMSPTRALRGANGIVAGARQTGNISWTATRSFVDDFFAPRTDTEQVMATHARTFRFATRFLPTDYRDSTLRLYAFFRTLDDLVDDSPSDPGSRLKVTAEVDAWAEWFHSGRQSPAPRPLMGRDISLICSTYDIPSRTFLDFLDGMRADLHSETPATRADVEHYSYQVASTVGITMAHVFRATGSSAISAATRLGIAMQLTNILRDVGGDLARERVYLPLSLLEKHNLSVEDVRTNWIDGVGPDERLRGAIQEMICWADEHYAAGISGIRLLPEDVRMPILISARLYQRILRQLERNDCDSLRKRAATTGWQKLSETMRAAIDVERPDSGIHSEVKETRVDAR